MKLHIHEMLECPSVRPCVRPGKYLNSIGRNFVKLDTCVQ